MARVQLAGQWFDYGDVLVDVMFGYACNVQCDYCSITDEMRLEPVSTAHVQTQLAEARARGAHKVAFGGGEPTIRKGLLPLIRWCRDRGYDSVKVSSNGLLYSYRNYVEDIVDAGANSFHLSLMAHTEDLYRSIMGKPGALALVTEGVRNLIALGQRPIADLIIKSDTWMHLADIVEHWSGLGIDTFNLWLVSLSDRNRANLDSLLPVAAMRPGIVAAFERGQQLGVRVLSRHIPRCMLPGYEEHLADLREDRVLVVTPRTSFSLWESKISPNAYAPVCDACAHARGACLGVRQDYLDRYGPGELVAIPPPPHAAMPLAAGRQA